MWRTAALEELDRHQYGLCAECWLGMDKKAYALHVAMHEAEDK